MNQRSRTERSIIRNRRRGTEVMPAPRPVVDLSAYKAEQVAKAKELIADGGLQMVSPAVFTAVSSDGTVRYCTAPDTCTCPAGIRSVRCYHTAAVRIALAA